MSGVVGMAAFGGQPRVGGTRLGLGNSGARGARLRAASPRLLGARQSFWSRLLSKRHGAFLEAG